MHISEKELEDYIYYDLRNNDGLELRERGLITVASEMSTLNEFKKWKWFRQIELGPYGICDIVGFARAGENIIIELFELKIVDLKSEDIDQLLRYKRAIHDFFGKRFTLKFRLYLVGSGIKDGHYIHNEITHLDLVEFKYDLSGIEFSQHSGGWSRGKGHESKATKLLQDAQKIHGY